ncbi:hypothetical protein ACG2LH_16670 [Zhouia sp. PK063]|uniref:hypothetical protein n=1 Tax=Zhouia sp. PK063 TaxID=3373602 RepID=UPI0037B936AE
MICYLAALITVCFYHTYTWAIIIGCHPYMGIAFVNYSRFIKSMGSKDIVMLCKRGMMLPQLLVSLLILIYAVNTINLLNGLLILAVLGYLFLEYTVTKRRTFIINNKGVEEIGKDKYRDFTAITSLEIYPNNIEFRFHENEILQLNSFEVMKPSWEQLVAQITELKANTTTDVSSSTMRSNT